VRDQVQFRRWEELCRQGEEDDRSDLDNLVNSRTVATEYRMPEQMSQLRADLELEGLTPLGTNIHIYRQNYSISGAHGY
jgi:hypothetical protein